VRVKTSIEKEYTIVEYDKYLKFIPRWEKKFDYFSKTHKIKFLANFINEFDNNFFHQEKRFIKNKRYLLELSILYIRFSLLLV